MAHSQGHQTGIKIQTGQSKDVESNGRRGRLFLAMKQNNGGLFFSISATRLS